MNYYHGYPGIEMGTEAHREGIRRYLAGLLNTLMHETYGHYLLNELARLFFGSPIDRPRTPLSLDSYQHLDMALRHTTHNPTGESGFWYV